MASYHPHTSPFVPWLRLEGEKPNMLQLMLLTLIDCIFGFPLWWYYRVYVSVRRVALPTTGAEYVAWTSAINL
eukprot:6728512-Ditylum_brightwellii.AAC.1